MALKDRIGRLEKIYNTIEPFPFCVVQRKGESLKEAVKRTLNGRTPPPNWHFILAPAKLSRKEWEAKYSPPG